MTALRHFLKLSDLSAAELRQVLDRAVALKGQRHALPQRFAGRTLAMIFTKNSTRTRVSFEAGMAKLGGHALYLHGDALQIGRNEPIADTAKVLSRMVDAVMIRNDSQADQQQLAQHATVPVINGLSELHHPCQLLADLMTWIEHRGPVAGKTVAWIGDGNNVCHSWIEAAALLGFHLRVACPEGFDPDAGLLASEGVTLLRDAAAAAKDADLVVTDTWTSMGQEGEEADRLAAFAPFTVDARIMACAKQDALFQHCLPAHRGEEVTAEVIDGPQSVVWDEAENRLWGQMALLEFLWTRRGTIA